ncbi:hypothetical protein V8C40DRAFT_229824 [Trichoderma camerunense]
MITKMVGPIDEEIILISLSGRDLGEGSPTSPTATPPIKTQACAQSTSGSLWILSENEAVFREIASHLQGRCNHLMRDYPRATLRHLRSALVTLAEQAGIRQNTVVTGEQIG